MLEKKKKKTYVITVATGRIGGRVARELLAAGQDVRVVGRDRARLEPLVALGAVPFAGDVRDRAFLEAAFAGADAALLVVKVDPRERNFRRTFAEVGEGYAAAARATNLGAAVFISSTGAHDDRHRGLVILHADVERALDAVPDLNVVHLRCAFFFENLLYFAPASRARGALSSPLDPATEIDMISTADIAEKATRLLRDLDFRGKKPIELRGPEVLSLAAIAQKIALLRGRPFGVEREPYDANIEGVIAMGANRDFATLINDTWALFNRTGLLRPDRSSFDERGRITIDGFLKSDYLPALET